MIVDGLCYHNKDNAVKHTLELKIQCHISIGDIKKTQIEKNDLLPFLKFVFIYAYEIY